jgi:hypothetical protein
MDILSLLKNGDKVKATRSGKTKEGTYIQSAEGKGFRIDGDPNLYSLSGFCNKALDIKNCDGKRFVSVERGGKDIKLYILARTQKNNSKSSPKNKSVKTTRFDKIAPYLNKDGETIYIGDKTAELVFEDEKWQIRYEDTLYTPALICKKLKGRQCDLLTNAFIVRDSKKLKLERLIPDFKPRKTTLKSGKKRKTHINKRLKAARHPNFGHVRKHENIVKSFILKNTHRYEPIPEQEIYRLQEGLIRHLKAIGVVKKKDERIALVKTILEKQNGTCYLSNQSGAYCWNTVKEMGWPYLKMEWAHVVPRCQKNTQTIDNLGLMCNRCNNNIQSSRRLEQLPMELLTKTQVILKKGSYDKSLIEKLDALIKDLPSKMICNSE